MNNFLTSTASKPLLALNALLAVLYFCTIAFVFPAGDPTLFALLIFGEIFHIWQVLTFIYTVWDTNYLPAIKAGVLPAVDVFITVAGEPVELVRQTVSAAKAMEYPESHVYILNDGYVARKDNWRDIEQLAAELGVGCITRTVGGGAKAGNINHALTSTSSPLIVIFDADHIPHQDFLLKTAPYFADQWVAFVQTPQYYRNYAENYLARSSWEQQEIFFGPICRGKNRLNSVTMCGTNMVLRRSALQRVGGMNTESIAEDFVTGLLMHACGYKSVYVPEVLAEGLATDDLSSYAKQQFRWARGSLDVLLRWNPLFIRGLTRAQRIQYISSASFYLSGLIIAIDFALPLVYFYTGLVPIIVSGMLLAGVFLPYFFITIYTIQRAANFTFTFSSLGMTMGSFMIQLQALGAALTFRRSAFVVTSKEKKGGTAAYVSLIRVHIAYVLLVVAGVLFAALRDGISASLINNSAWALLNIIITLPFVANALPILSPQIVPEEEAAVPRTRSARVRASLPQTSL